MNSHKEIERKFVVAQLPDLSNAAVEVILQGYLTMPSDSVQVRVRQKGEQFFITMKSGAGLARMEHEAQIDRVAFSKLWPATLARRIEKTRWTSTLPDQHRFELDIFDGALSGLKMVEVEFRDEAQAHEFVPPPWFGCDVTEDERYSNASLAEFGVPMREGTAPAL